MVRLFDGLVSCVPEGVSTCNIGVSFLMCVTIIKKNNTVKMRSGIDAMFKDGTLCCLCRFIFNITISQVLC